MTALDWHATGFAVRHAGRIDDRVRASFRAYVRARGVSGEIDDALDAACARYRSEDGLYVCDGTPCRGVQQSATCDGVPVHRTGCQGFCKHKPMVALKVGEHRELIGRSHSDDVAAFARAAWREKSLLVPERSAIEPLRIDEEHGEAPAAQLRAAHFLLARFRGAGRYADGSYSFTKEVVGSYEAGGRFLSLRMEAHYPTSDGVDTHRALVIVGASRDTLAGRAYTDGGDIYDYAIRSNGTELEFADRSPDHERAWKNVRKRLRPTQRGYEERLEVDRGQGFEPYYVVEMSRA